MGTSKLVRETKRTTISWKKEINHQEFERHQWKTKTWKRRTNEIRKRKR